MKTRCYNKTSHNYKNYGGRGITYDEKWETFDGFWRDMSSGYADNLTIERINTDKNYYKENCRWATTAEQNNNQRTNINIEIDGVKKTAGAWADVYGINRSTVYYRIKRGLPIQEILKK
jgi:hypothetical protein